VDDAPTADIDAVMAVARATRHEMRAERRFVCVHRRLKVGAHGCIRLAGCRLRVLLNGLPVANYPASDMPGARLRFYKA
jgi:hypothetical protein